MTSGIQIEDIQAARDRIAPHIIPLRIAESAALSKQFDREILLAHEYLQTTGAFKLRGAMNSVLQLDSGTTGVTAVSTGNHGRALAYSARKAGVPCIICMSELVPRNKLEAIRALGAETRIIGKSQDEAEIEALRRSVALTDAAFDHLMGVIQPGMTEREAAWEIEAYMRTHGASKVAFDLIVAAGPNGALPHARPGDHGGKAYGAETHAAPVNRKTDLYLGTAVPQAVEWYAQVDIFMPKGRHGRLIREKEVDLVEPSP